jgi:DNA-binding winged helix-turn-helix (wHTH) protein
MSSARHARLPLAAGNSSESSRSSNPNRNNALYDFGNFRIDESNQRLIHKQHIVAIQPRTFETLIALIKLTLVRGKDGLITKDELMREVWHDASVEEGNLPDAISNLRTALGDDPRKPTYIATAHRKGYRFLADITVSERETGEPEQAEQTERYQAAISELMASADVAKRDAQQHKTLLADELVKRRDYERTIAELTSANDSATRELARHETARAKFKRWAVLGAGCAALAAVGAFVSGRALLPGTSRSTSARLSLPLLDIKEPASFSISRDGGQIVFSALSAQGRRFLYVRSMTADSPVRIDGTEGGVQPFWSPDGGQIGFFADDKLKTIDRDGAFRRCYGGHRAPEGEAGILRM